MSVNNINEQILQYLKENPGSRAREISDNLDLDKSEVNSRLYSELRSKCYQDKQYRWFYGQYKKASNPETRKSITDTVLSKLCKYYSACLAEDAGTEVSVFAQSKYGLDYKEIDELPLEDTSELFKYSEVQDFLKSTKRDRTKALYFGYPSVLKHIKSKRSDWEGFKVEPVFLFPFHKSSEDENSFYVDLNFPIINKHVVANYTQASGAELISEIVHLEEELGLGAEQDSPELDELAQRLKAIRPDWRWVESLNPYNLSAEPPLGEIEQEGIYNRATVLKVKQAPSSYTRGLEFELDQLAQLKEENYKDTALGKWLSRDITKNEKRNLNSLLNVFPMNLEQREAISKSLSEELTVITGPPGTGKSQVVSNLVVNSRWQGKKILFASKNNKAVDIVDTRVNSLTDKPVILRLGSRSDHQDQLIQYISNLLSSSTTGEEQQAYRNLLNKYKNIQNKYFTLDSDENDLVELRNNVDKYEQKIEPIRQKISKELFVKSENINTRNLKDTLNPLIDNITTIKNTQNNFVLKILHTFLKTKRYEEINKQISDLQNILSELEIELPGENISDYNLKGWFNIIDQIQERLSDINSVSLYYEALDELRKHPALEEIAKEKLELIELMSSESQELWDLWLKQEAANLSSEERNVLNQYRTTLQMVSEENASKKAWSNYYRQSEKVSHILSCMAITSLSAKGRIPFQPGIFDIVVFDEASQCDIASALPLLYRAKNAVVIGDPNQLSHISPIHNKEDQRLLEKYGLLDQFSDWAYSYNSLYDLAAGLSSAHGIIDLRDHYRSHADIINFSNRTFYEGRLRVATKYDQLRRVNFNDPGIRWVDVEGQPERPASGSGSINKNEAQKVIEELRKLVESGYTGSIGVVSPFRAQANLIKQLVYNDKNLYTQLLKNDFLSDTAHGFQGDERDIMLFSPVISPNLPKGSLFFLKKTGNLFNVAITRARAMLIVVGNSNFITKCGVKYMEEFAEYVNRLDKESKKEQKYFPQDIGPEYPTVAHPERVSDWERVLYKALYDAGILSIPQYQEERYTLDFAVFSEDGRKLNVEVDGEHYHKDWNGELAYRDQIRNQRMYELGWDVKRFWVYQVRDNLQQCVADVQEWLTTNQNE